MLKLVIAGEFVSSVDVTEASALIGAAEESIVLQAEQMKSSLVAMNTAAEVLLAETAVPYRNISWSFPGVATLNATNKGRLEVGSKISETDELGFHEIMVPKSNRSLFVMCSSPSWD